MITVQFNEDIATVPDKLNWSGFSHPGKRVNIGVSREPASSLYTVTLTDSDLELVMVLTVTVLVTLYVPAATEMRHNPPYYDALNRLAYLCLYRKKFAIELCGYQINGTRWRNAYSKWMMQLYLSCVNAIHANCMIGIFLAGFFNPENVRMMIPEKALDRSARCKNLDKPLVASALTLHLS